jgi:pimeloyl-ACP methyl ester carboxylesterase
MIKNLLQLSLAILFLAAPVPSFAAEERLILLDTRPGVSVMISYAKHADAKATVVLLPGGTGGFRLKSGAPASGGFLFDNRDNFFSSGFNVAVVNKPSDVKDLDFDFRSGPEHVEDLRQVVAFLKKEGGLPIWLVGTSRGTISATAAAITFGNNDLAGIVLTSSITAWWKNGDVPSQDLETIRIPVLVVHHALDSCSICVPTQASRIIQGLTNAPVKKLIMVTGGGPPSGDECTSSHWHGFVGREQKVVRIIADWIKKPVN